MTDTTTRRTRRTRWEYRGVGIERSRVTGYYVARTGGHGLTADTLAGMRELIREHTAGGVR